MVFNSDVWKQAQQVVFSCKAIAANPETVYFNNDPVIRENFQKYLSLFLDSKLYFFDYINPLHAKLTK